jgi:hypothetical protein
LTCILDLSWCTAFRHRFRAQDRDPSVLLKRCDYCRMKCAREVEEDWTLVQVDKDALHK